jgi:hypothetical protein
VALLARSWLTPEHVPAATGGAGGGSGT